MKKLAAELVTIVLGVLIALGFDDWRQDREEIRIANEHLYDITAELRGNLCTVERVRMRQMPRKFESLQIVLNFLNDPTAKVEDPAALLNAFVRSTLSARPWLVDNQYQALQNSGNLRLVSNLQPGLSLAAIYESPDVLFSQDERIRGSYPVVVNGLIPAQLQAEFSQLRGYARETHAPAMVDNTNLSQAIDAIRARRVELLELARNEAAVATGRWYALTRMSQDLNATVTQLARWDRSTTPLQAELAECTTAAIPSVPNPLK